MELSRYIDHTLLRATATEAEIIKLCQEAVAYNFYAVCVNGCYVRRSAQELSGTNVSIASVVGFPLGAMVSAIKIREAISAIELGAHEVDMVFNIGYLKAQQYTLVEKEISDIKKAIGNSILKVIIETCYLSNEEKKIAIEIVGHAGADFIKTSTGFGTGGATVEDITLMKALKKESLKIKASGSIRDVSTALELIAAGSDRLGTSSGIAIVTHQAGENTKY